MFRSIVKCRMCGNPKLARVLDLGEQVLTGVFPRDVNQQVTRGPLVLLKCTDSPDACGLLQLGHSYDLAEMYGDNYGYRSSLNPSMVRHLREKVSKVMAQVTLDRESIVIDIGSNDGTTLAAYPPDQCVRVGVDPTARKFMQYYPSGVTVLPDFFSAKLFHEVFPGRRATVITSFSMFYDLEDPLHFAREVSSILADEGVWVFEQSYMPLMLERNSFDTVCHEHLEYYGLKQIKWLLDRSGMKMVDVEFNDVNGGSFSVTAAKQTSHRPVSELAQKIIRDEEAKGLDTLEPYLAFAKRVSNCRDAIRSFVQLAKDRGQRVIALGASTKGNVILQYCGFTPSEIEAVGEVNPDKFGAFTPGTLIPIVDEKGLLEQGPQYAIVLPWHFRDFFLGQEAFRNTKLVFPLPQLEVI